MSKLLLDLASHTHHFENQDMTWSTNGNRATQKLALLLQSKVHLLNSNQAIHTGKETQKEEKGRRSKEVGLLLQAFQALLTKAGMILKR